MFNARFRWLVALARFEFLPIQKNARAMKSFKAADAACEDFITVLCLIQGRYRKFDQESGFHITEDDLSPAGWILPGHARADLAAFGHERVGALSQIGCASSAEQGV